MSSASPSHRQLAEIFFAERLRHVPGGIGVGVCAFGEWAAIEVFDDPSAAARRSLEMDASGLDAYATAGLFEVGKDRRLASDCVGISGMWLDIDLLGSPQRDGGVKQLGAPSRAAAIDLAHRLVRPTFVVLSGGGLQPWYLLKHPVLMDSAQQRSEVARVVAGFERAHASLVDWQLDSTHDLARLLRVPGTSNWKTGEPRPVSMRRPRRAS